MSAQFAMPEEVANRITTKKSGFSATGIDALGKSLVSAQKDLHNPTEDATGRFKYLSLQKLIAETKPILQKNGLAIVQFPGVNTEQTVELRTLLLHESGQYIEHTMTMSVDPTVKGNTLEQRQGAALTYCRRYAWQSVIGLCSEPDTDGASDSMTTTQTQKPRIQKTGSKNKATKPQIKFIDDLCKGMSGHDREMFCKHVLKFTYDEDTLLFENASSLIEKLKSGEVKKWIAEQRASAKE
jgi:hypothetical protein